MAVRPSFGQKVNGIVRFIEDPCEAPWIVYLELAREPFKKALLTWFTFGLADVMRGYFRPRGVRGRRHGRGRGKGGARAGLLVRALRRIPGIGDDVGNFIGKRLPGAHALNQRQVSQGVKNLWFIDGVLQRGLWWWLVIGITTDFLYEWTTLLQQSEFCQRTAQKGGYSTGNMSGVLAIQGWQEQIGLVEQRNHGGLVLFDGGAVLGPGRWTVIYGLQMEQIGNPGSAVHFCRIREAGGATIVGQSSGDKVKLGGISSLIAIGEVEGPKTVLVEALTTFGAAAGKTGDFWVTGA